MTQFMEIKEVTVLKGLIGYDQVYIKTDLPPSVAPFTEPPWVSFDVAVGKGDAYCRKYFPEAKIFVVHSREELIKNAEINP